MIKRDRTKLEPYIVGQQHKDSKKLKKFSVKIEDKLINHLINQLKFLCIPFEIQY